MHEMKYSKPIVKLFKSISISHTDWLVFVIVLIRPLGVSAACHSFAIRRLLVNTYLMDLPYTKRGYCRPNADTLKEFLGQVYNPN